jgi:sterol carrier protein 2
MAWFETARDELQFFGGAGQAYVEEFGIDPAVFAEISIKARKHAANNPNAMSPTAR